MIFLLCFTGDDRSDGNIRNGGLFLMTTIWAFQCHCARVQAKSKSCDTLFHFFKSVPRFFALCLSGKDREEAFIVFLSNTYKTMQAVSKTTLPSCLYEIDYTVSAKELTVVEISINKIL